MVLRLGLASGDRLHDEPRRKKNETGRPSWLVLLFFAFVLGFGEDQSRVHVRVQSGWIRFSWMWSLSLQIATATGSTFLPLKLHLIEKYKIPPCNFS